MLPRFSESSAKVCLTLAFPLKATSRALSKAPPLLAAAATSTEGQQGHQGHPRGKTGRFAFAAASAGALTGVGAWFGFGRQEKEDVDPQWSLDNNDPRPRPDLPTYSLGQLKEHVTPETGIWVSYRGAVYDVTKFMAAHPGGKGRLEMAAGNDLEPYWDVYRLHYRGHIVPLLEEKYRIGSLSKADSIKAKEFEFSDPYESDPPRHIDSTPCTHKPYCGETRLDLLAESYFTPNEIFYKRNHYPVPDISEEEYELVIEGNGVKRTVFSLHDLKTKFQQIDVVATIQCAGNRGEDFHGIGNGPSTATFLAPHWSVGAISNAKWTGVRIRDLLKVAGMDVDALHDGSLYLKNGQHIQMWSYDMDESGENYGASTYMDKIVDPNGDAIIAFAMNDKPLPKDHGFPCRAIIPGHAGARQPKWIHRLEIGEKPYCVLQCLNFAPDVTFEKDLSNWPPKGMDAAYRAKMVVQEMPVQSLVCQPPQNATLGAKGLKSLTFKGVAWSGGGSGIKRVEVSADNGKSFTEAQLFKPVEQKRSLCIIPKEIPLSEDIKTRLAKGEKVQLTLTSKAVDSSFNVQPENPEPYVNPRGTAVNHWYRVSVTLDPSLPAKTVINPAATAAAEGRYANTPTGGVFRSPFKEGGWEVKNAQKEESPLEWHKYDSSKIDWKYYQNLWAPSFYEKSEIIVGECDKEE